MHLLAQKMPNERYHLPFIRHLFNHFYFCESLLMKTKLDPSRVTT